MGKGTNGDFVDRWKPAVRRERLYFIAGGAWATAAGVLLVRGIAYRTGILQTDALLALVALVCGLLFFRVMFRKIVEKNIRRIQAMTLERPCLFSFQSWRSWLIMSMMIAMGITARLSGLIPASGLGTVYLTMAVPLGVSSARLIRQGIAGTV